MTVAWIALGVSLVSVGWQVFTWRHGQRFNVRARIEGDQVEVASGKYEVTVIAENFGATDEAVQEVWLIYAEHHDLDDTSRLLGPPSVRVSESADLPPNRNVRRTFDLLASRFGPIPSELVAVVVLQSGKRVVSQPYEISVRMLSVAMAGRTRPAAWDEQESSEPGDGQ